MPPVPLSAAAIGGANQLSEERVDHARRNVRVGGEATSSSPSASKNSRSGLSGLSPYLNAGIVHLSCAPQHIRPTGAAGVPGFTHPAP